MNVGDVLTFNYTGGVQTANLTDKGLYKLETWGAEGEIRSGHANVPGKGGHSVGYIIVDSPISLYVCVGGNNGYNGGGNGGWGDGASKGGGATHIAKVNGILRNIGKTSFVTNGNGLIVSGGGGGSYDNGYGQGGTGGGTSGGDGYHSSIGGANTGMGGTQASGGSARGDGNPSSGFGFGASGNYDGGGGGGGLYGGGGGGNSAGGGGGSGYIGGVPAITFKGQTYSPSMSNGVRSGNGLATITYVDKSTLPIKKGTVDVVTVKKGTVDVSSLFKGTTPIS